MKTPILIGLFYTTLALGAEPLAPLSKPDTVHEAARLALAQGVAWFKERAAQDPEGWLVGHVFFEPQPHAGGVGGRLQRLPIARRHRVNGDGLPANGNRIVGCYGDIEVRCL